MWNEITHPFPNFNGTTVEVWDWISNIISHITGHVILCMLGFKLNHVSIRDQRSVASPKWYVRTISQIFSPYRLQFICENMKPYLYFQLFLKTRLAQAVEIHPRQRQEYIYVTKFIPWLLVTEGGRPSEAMALTYFISECSILSSRMVTF